MMSYRVMRADSGAHALWGHNLLLGPWHDHGVGWEVLAILIDHGNKRDHLQVAASATDCARLRQTCMYLYTQPVQYRAACLKCWKWPLQGSPLQWPSPAPHTGPQCPWQAQESCQTPTYLAQSEDSMHLSRALLKADGIHERR